MTLILSVFAVFIPLSSSIAIEQGVTTDVSFELNEVLEYDRLIDSKGYSACDHYFGWAGLPPVKTEEQKLLCGKYQFLYEHWSTAGIPKSTLQFNEKWYPKFYGDELSHFGYFPDDNPKRIVSDIVPVQAGQCVETEKVCSAKIFGHCIRWKEQCVRTAQQSSWQEIFELVEDDQLPVGFQLGPKKGLGFESAAFACAGCHMGTLADGRYAIGMANKNLNYGQVYAGFNTPMQATLIALTDLLNNPMIGGIISGYLEGNDELPDDFLNGLLIHPGVAFNNPGTEVGFSYDKYPSMISDLKTGTCYFKDNGALIRCDHRHEEKGPQHYRAQAKKMFSELKKEYSAYSGVVKSDWPMAMKELFGDAYCMPKPLKPSDWGGDDSLPWSQFEVSLSLQQTARNMAESCDGLRWNVYYWEEFAQYLGAMSSADTGAVAFPSFSEQETMINAGFNVLDFLIAPMSDDHVWTISRIPNVVGIPSHDELLADSEMRTESGVVSPMLSLAGNVTSLETFIRSFVLLSGSVDPRYVECGNPNIVGNWDASPDDTCELIPGTIDPLIAYILTLEPPQPVLNQSSPSIRGRELFNDSCQGCHSGPKGESAGVFLFSEIEKEGLASNIETCPDNTLTVEWTGESLPKAIFNHCRPSYDTTHSVKYLGFIGTDANYSRIGNPVPSTGKPGETPELETDTVASQGVKAQRLVGVRYRSEMFHHGQLRTLDDVLCKPDTPRATKELRTEPFCLVYDLDSEEGLNAYKKGEPICIQEWFPYRGHEFGCDLENEDKDALIEYLKSL